jgi:hypothetical protein
MGWFREFLSQVRDPQALAALTRKAIPYGELSKLLED